MEPALVNLGCGDRFPNCFSDSRNQLTDPTLYFMFDVLWNVGDFLQRSGIFFEFPDTLAAALRDYLGEDSCDPSLESGTTGPF